ncbi:MAG TPA: HoxN/HupN/NixA family nickel/cobalt transporter [Acidimicrobiales bacterium]|nr:HoxN/HupN/NixA family nickel/cobalt transporter [Acidimicrobiales bacterium]
MGWHTDEAQSAGGGGWRFTAREWTRLAGFFGVIGLLHVAGWGLYLLYVPRYSAMAGLGVLAYTFGLRHAFDADHISAIDDTTRFLLQKGSPPLGVGFFFSLGHSTIVFCMALAVALATQAVQTRLPWLKSYGAPIGTSVSGLFLWTIGLLNLFVLLDIIQVWRQTKRGRFDEQRLEDLLLQRGLLNRLCGGRLQRLITHSWQMFPVGVLFGLGFDTASEIALLTITAGVATGTMPLLAVLALPLLFAAGMSLMDTADGAFMAKAYRWAFSSPLRKIYYNLTTTGLSVAVALMIGTIEVLQVLSDQLAWQGPFSATLRKLDFQRLGYGIVGLFLCTWGLSVVLWKVRRLEER